MSNLLATSLFFLLGRSAAAQDETTSTDAQSMLLHVSVDDRAGHVLLQPKVKIGGTSEVELRDDGVSPDALAGDHLFTGQVRAARGQAVEMSVLETGFGSPFVLGSGTLQLANYDEDALTIVIPPNGAGTFEARLARADASASSSMSSSTATGEPANGQPVGPDPNAPGATNVSAARLDPWPLLLGLLVLAIVIRVWLRQWYRSDLAPLARELRRHIARQADGPGRPFLASRYLEALRANTNSGPLPWGTARPTLLVGGSDAGRRALTASLATSALDRGAAVVLAGASVGEWTLADRLVQARTQRSPSVDDALAALPDLTRLDGRAASGPFGALEGMEVVGRLSGPGAPGLLMYEGLPGASGDPYTRIDAALADLGELPPGATVAWILPAGLIDLPALQAALRGGDASGPVRTVVEGLGAVGVIEEADGQIRVRVTTREPGPASVWRVHSSGAALSAEGAQ